MTDKTEREALADAAAWAAWPCSHDYPERDAYREGFLAALRSQPAGEWLPIESAPKDGGVIRLFDPTLYDGEFNFYFDGHHTDCGPDDQACWMGPVYSGCHDEWITMRINPTHWRPLSSPPAQGEKS